MKFKHYFRDTANGHIWGSDDPSMWRDCEKLTRAEGLRLYRAQACEQLRAMIKPGDTVYTCLRNVSASGMSRRISVHVIQTETRNGKRATVLRDVSGYVATALDYPIHDRTHALVVGGCGMDMGFHVVYSLGRTLWKDGTLRRKGARRDTGYALNQEWI